MHLTEQLPARVYDITPASQSTFCAQSIGARQRLNARRYGNTSESRINSLAQHFAKSIRSIKTHSLQA